MDKDRYIEHLEDLIHDLHSALELTVYDIEEIDAKGDTARKAQQFWDDFCSLKSQNHPFSNNDQ